MSDGFGGTLGPLDVKLAHSILYLLSLTAIAEGRDLEVSEHQLCRGLSKLEKTLHEDLGIPIRFDGVPPNRLCSPNVSQAVSLIVPFDIDAGWEYGIGNILYYSQARAKLRVDRLAENFNYLDRCLLMNSLDDFRAGIRE
jgi:hypothetical protein